MRLETRALHWLLYESHCWFACCQRTPRNGIGQPDVLGVKQGRHLVEIEIKRSVSDFRADSKKHSKLNRPFAIERYPRQFYYLIPAALVVKVMPILPEWAGLMSDGAMWVKIERLAPVNNKSKRLTIEECVRLGRNMANHIASCEARFDDHFQRFKDGHWQSSDYQI